MMVDDDFIEAFRQVWTDSFQLRVNAVFFRVMYCVRVDGHVSHDIVHQLVVTVLATVKAIGLVLEEVEHNAHIPVVCTEFG